VHLEVVLCQATLAAITITVHGGNFKSVLQYYGTYTIGGAEERKKLI
jgi:hypothetical protein